MGILRSETMKHGTIILPSERARYFVELLGRKVQLQIEDMNAISMKRNYRKYIQRYGIPPDHNHCF
jgi:V-type H+-transporting ATPase subunit a